MRLALLASLASTLCFQPLFAQCKNSTSVRRWSNSPRVYHVVSYRAHTKSSKAKDIVDTAVSAGSFHTFVAAVKAAGLVETLKSEGPFTVFAPTDDAFAKLPKETLQSLLKPENKEQLQAILTYHVVPGKVLAKDVASISSATTVNGQSVAISAKGSAVEVGNANVIKADVLASNGVIHVIDTVLLPNQKDIVDTAVAAGSFNTLVAAAKAAGLVEALKGEGPLTVFAPTDEAFAKLPEGTVENLLKPENKEQLQAILTYHVVPAKVLAADVVKVDSASTLNGQKVAVNVTDSGVMVGEAKVVKTDIETTNGVIHVIDQVLIPKN